MTARVLLPTPDHLSLVAQALKQGQVVGMPTETVYGLAGDALNPIALTRIFEAKERPTFDPLIVHVAPSMKISGLMDLERLELVRPERLPPAARAQVDQLIRKFWPGALTLVLPKHERVPDLATSGLTNVALRMPRHPVAQALITEAGMALAAPSANRFGRISPTSAADVASELGERIPFILDGGPCEIGVESTVLGFDPEGHPVLLRPGGVSLEELERVLLTPVLLPPKSGELPRPSAPGMLLSHYAPRKPLVLLPTSVFEIQAHAFRSLVGGDSRLQRLRGFKRAGLLLQQGNPGEAADYFSKMTGLEVTARSLSESGDRNEAARNLFSSLRALDESDVSVLFAEPCRDDAGLGHAIADRLRRASAPAGL